MDGLQQLLAAGRVDYTIFWRRLSRAVADGKDEPVRDLFADRAAFDAWSLQYKELLARDDKAMAADLMLKPTLLRAAQPPGRTGHTGCETWRPFSTPNLQRLLARPLTNTRVRGLCRLSRPTGPPPFHQLLFATYAIQKTDAEMAGPAA